jgi:peptide-methionine (S)-S-oxide reductase
MRNLSNAIIVFCLLSTGFAFCAQNTKSNGNSKAIMETAGKLDTATFGAGCFWCVEAIFQNLDGVESVASGYSGGHVKNPAYKEVCNGTTGHAEVIQLTYDPSKITFEELLEVFWQTHDPTTLNRQGADVGTQYRSAIFYHNDKQKELAETYRKKLDESGAFDKPIVTEISPIKNFYKAEDYHQNYYNQNSEESYCTFVIRPKLDKFKKVFGDKMKKP